MIDWDDLEARNVPLNAFVDWDRSAIGGGGPLAGVTIGVKSNMAVKGLPWTAGMGLHHDRIATEDATVVARLRAGGAAILGTLNMHEAALGATTDNAWFGATHNPHRIGHTPGGSSGGSGAAVAAGLCDAALGTDTLGSVRIPAAYCGVYGLKPTHGAMPDDGLEPLHRGFDAIGPLAASLEMLERMWTAMCPGERRGPVASRSATGPRPSPGNVRVLSQLGGVRCEAAVLTAYDRALTTLSATATLPLPPLDRIRVAAFVEAARELSASLGPDRHSDRISPALRWLLAYGDAAPRDLDLLAEVRETLIDALGNDGILVLPTAPQAAFAHGGRAPVNQADFTCLASIAGLPALALPSRHADGLPVGIQIVGPAGSEATLFDVARTLDGHF